MFYLKSKYWGTKLAKQLLYSTTFLMKTLCCVIVAHQPCLVVISQTPRRSQLTESTELLEPSVPEQGKRKQQRNKLMHKNGVEKPPSRYKRRKKEEEEKPIGYSSTDTLMTQLKQVQIIVVSHRTPC